MLSLLRFAPAPKVVFEKFEAFCGLLISAGRWAPRRCKALKEHSAELHSSSPARAVSVMSAASWSPVHAARRAASLISENVFATLDGCTREMKKQEGK